MVEPDQQCPVIDYLAPAPFATYTAPAPMVDYITPVPAVACTAQAPVDSCIAQQPVVSFLHSVDFIQCSRSPRWFRGVDSTTALIHS